MITLLQSKATLKYRVTMCTNKTTICLRETGFEKQIQPTDYRGNGHFQAIFLISVGMEHE